MPSPALRSARHIVDVLLSTSWRHRDAAHVTSPYFPTFAALSDALETVCLHDSDTWLTWELPQRHSGRMAAVHDPVGAWSDRVTTKLVRRVAEMSSTTGAPPNSLALNVDADSDATSSSNADESAEPSDASFAVLQSQELGPCFDAVPRTQSRADAAKCAIALSSAFKHPVHGSAMTSVVETILFDTAAVPSWLPRDRQLLIVGVGADAPLPQRAVVRFLDARVASFGSDSDSTLHKTLKKSLTPLPLRFGPPSTSLPARADCCLGSASATRTTSRWTTTGIASCWTPPPCCLASLTTCATLCRSRRRMRCTVPWTLPTTTTSSGSVPATWTI